MNKSLQSKLLNVKLHSFSILPPQVGAEILPGWDETETGTRPSDLFIYETRPRLELTQNFRQDQEETESLGDLFYETEMRANF